MFEKPRRGRRATNFTTNVPKIVDLKSSSEQIFSKTLSLGAPGSLASEELIPCCSLLVGIPGAPLTYFNDGEVRRISFGSDIVAKRDFFGSMKDAGIFLGRENNTGIFWVLYFSSAQIKNNISAIYSFVFDQNQS